jgi:hypothetical protein
MRNYDVVFNIYLKGSSNENHMNPQDPLYHKPKSIVAAKNILYATIFLGIINVVINEMTPGLGNASTIEGIVISGVTLAVIFVLTRQIGMGRKWARTVFLVLFILGIVLFPFALGAVFRISLLLGILEIFEAILQAIALIFLFSQDSTVWFNKIRSWRANEPQPVQHEQP